MINPQIAVTSLIDFINSASVLCMTEHHKHLLQGIIQEYIINKFDYFKHYTDNYLCLEDMKPIYDLVDCSNFNKGQMIQYKTEQYIQDGPYLLKLIGVKFISETTFVSSEKNENTYKSEIEIFPTYKIFLSDSVFQCFTCLSKHYKDSKLFKDDKLVVDIKDITLPNHLMNEILKNKIEHLGYRINTYKSEDILNAINTKTCWSKLGILVWNHI